MIMSSGSPPGSPPLSGDGSASGACKDPSAAEEERGASPADEASMLKDKFRPRAPPPALQALLQGPGADAVDLPEEPDSPIPASRHHAESKKTRISEGKPGSVEEKRKASHVHPEEDGGRLGRTLAHKRQKEEKPAALPPPLQKPPPAVPATQYFDPFASASRPPKPQRPAAVAAPSSAQRTGPLPLEKLLRSPSPGPSVYSAFKKRFYGVSPIDDYVFLDKVGEGTFGEVHKARNKGTGQLVALKRIIESHHNEGFPITSLREIKILKKLQHKNIISIVDIAVSKDSDESVFVVFPFVDHDLVGLLDAPTVNFSLSQIKCYARQLLEGTAYLHSQNILHRDMKTANILINNRGELKIADFGLARPFRAAAEGGGQYTGGVVTRWYRPPELVLGDLRYSTPVDLWGVGCIILEMFTRTPVFQGSSDIDQLAVILEVCGSPSEPSVLFSLPEAQKISLGAHPRKFAEKFGWIDRGMFDLIEKMLELDPGRRLSAAQALQHPVWAAPPLPAQPTDLPTYAVSFHELGKRRKDALRQQSSARRPEPPRMPPSSSSAGTRRVVDYSSVVSTSTPFDSGQTGPDNAASSSSSSGGLPPRPEPAGQRPSSLLRAATDVKIMPAPTAATTGGTATRKETMEKPLQREMPCAGVSRAAGAEPAPLPSGRRPAPGWAQASPLPMGWASTKDTSPQPPTQPGSAEHSSAMYRRFSRRDSPPRGLPASRNRDYCMDDRRMRGTPCGSAHGRPFDGYHRPSDWYADPYRYYSDTSGPDSWREDERYRRLHPQQYQQYRGRDYGHGSHQSHLHPPPHYSYGSQKQERHPDAHQQSRPRHGEDYTVCVRRMPGDRQEEGPQVRPREPQPPL